MQETSMKLYLLFNNDFLFGLLCNSDDGGDMFLQKVNQLSQDYMALHPRRQN
jgi:hypothetical protein